MANLIGPHVQSVVQGDAAFSVTVQDEYLLEDLANVNNSTVLGRSV